MLQQKNNYTHHTTLQRLMQYVLDALHHILILVAFLMFFSFIQVAAAQTSSQSHLLLNNEQTAQLVKTDIEMRVTGMINRVQVTQIFDNPTEEWVEGQYLFPLPHSAIVDKLRIKIGERIIDGEVVERSAAKQQYEKAKRAGKRVSLLDQERPNLFTTSIANIAPHEQIRIEISYQHIVAYEQGEFSLRMPLAITPRYIPGYASSEHAQQELNLIDVPEHMSAEDIKRITPTFTQDGTQSPVSLHIELDAGFPLADLDSRYHAIQKTNHGPGRYSIRFRHGAVLAKRDFELFWAPEPSQVPRASLFHENVAGQSYYFGMLLPQDSDTSAMPVLNKDIVFVIDRSGSMGGASMRQARNALLKALKDLQPQDTFNVISFNHQTRSLFTESKPASVMNISRARQFVAAMNANGGTEMLPALREALQQEKSESYLRQIIFLTDGAVGNEQALFELINTQLHNTRLFTIGIGSAPNSHLLTQAARLGRGTYTYIGDINEVEVRLKQLFGKINKPALHDIQVQHALPDAQLTPEKISDLYMGEPLMFALKTAATQGEIEVVGYRGEQRWSRQLNLSASNNGTGIAKYWASQRIKELLEQRDKGTVDSHRQSILALALEHQIVSPYTSLLTVDKSVVRDPGQALKQQRIPSNLATRQAVSYNSKQVIALQAKTATAAELKMIIGLVCLILGLLLKQVLRRRFPQKELFE